MKIGISCFLIYMVLLCFSCNNSKTAEVEQSIPKDSIVIDSTILSIDQTEPILIKTPEDIGWKFEQFWADSTIYLFRDTTKKAFSFQISTIYPIQSPSSLNLEAIQKAFVKVIAKTDDIEIQDDINIEDAFKKQIKFYVDLGKSYKEEEEEESGFFQMNYHSSSSISVRFVSENIMTLDYFASSYEGGPHNMFSVHFYNISTKDGDIIYEQRLFKSGYEVELAKIIQNEIERRDNLADESKHLNLYIDLLKVKPNGNFYFENTGITYIYNVYEINGFVNGGADIHIPYAKLKSLIKEEYLPLIESIEKNKIYELESIRSEDGVLIKN